jgi:hypothetical protein
MVGTIPVQFAEFLNFPQLKLLNIEYLKYGGGGGSRTRVRNRCQLGEFMLCPLPEISPHALRTDKMRIRLVRLISLLPPGPSRSSQPTV